MENQDKKKEYIDLRVVVRKLHARRKTFYKVLPIVFVLACAYSFCLPRYYSTSLKLVPEMAGSGMGGGGLADLASSFGFDLGDMNTNDAISPLLYPDLMDDNGFVASLFEIRVQSSLHETEDERIDTTYYSYIRYKQKKPFWSKWFASIGKLFSSGGDMGGTGSGEFDPYRASKKDNGVMNIMRDNVKIDIDKKTGVITLTTKAQDPLIAKTLADSVAVKLQTFITQYRTNKAKVDMGFYRDMADNAKQEYDSVRRAFSQLSDSNYDVFLSSISTQRDDLERDMQLKYNTYTTLETQYQTALARVQERTPAFTMLRGADVPVRHAGPKRMFIVAGWLFMAFLITSLRILWKDIKRQLSRS